MKDSNGVALYFQCGCMLIYYVGGPGELGGGLSCCREHEEPYQRLQNILPLTLARVKYLDDPSTTDAEPSPTGG